MTDELLDGLTTPEAIVAAEKNPANLARLANILMSNDREARAVELARRALVLAPDDGEVKSIAGAVLRRLVPGWHFSIVRDEARNRAYDEALRRNVRPGMQVLEIGPEPRGAPSIARPQCLGRLDLDDIGPPVGQLPCRRRPRPQPGQVQNPEAGERAFADRVVAHANSSRFSVVTRPEPGSLPGGPV